MQLEIELTSLQGGATTASKARRAKLERELAELREQAPR